MKIGAKLASAISRQVNNEFSAYYSYLACAVWFDLKEFKGFANWFYKQADEEKEHAMKLVAYLIDRDGKVELQSIAEPKPHLTSILSAFQFSVSQEEANTASISKLVDSAVSEKDHMTVSFLKWFVDEQVEEESAARHAMELVKLAGDDSSAILRLDHELGKRGK